MKRTFTIALIGISLGLSGCASVASFVSNAATALSSSTPNQVTTLAQAEQAATLVTQAADVAVNTGKLNAATLKEIEALSAAIHAAIDGLEAANAAGKSLDFASFNAALSAYNAYMTSTGITH